MITGSQFIEHLYSQGYYYYIEEQREFGVTRRLGKIGEMILRPYKNYKSKRAEYFLEKAKESKNLMNKADVDLLNYKNSIDNKKYNESRKFYKRRNF